MAIITYSYVEHYERSCEFCAKDSPRPQELYDKGCAEKYENDGVV